MAPNKDSIYHKDEKVLCFHHELLYEAKVIESRPSIEADKKSVPEYKIHYKGWKSTWDDWVPGDRLRKFNDENLELAASLKGQADELRRQSAPTIPTGKPRKRPLESDLSSARASEDGQTNARGHKRGREHNDIEKTRGVSPSFRDAASTEQTLGRRPAIASQRPPLNRLVPSS